MLQQAVVQAVAAASLRVVAVQAELRVAPQPVQAAVSQVVQVAVAVPAQVVAVQQPVLLVVQEAVPFADVSRSAPSVKSLSRCRLPRWVACKCHAAMAPRQCACVAAHH